LWGSGVRKGGGPEKKKRSDIARMPIKGGHHSSRPEVYVGLRGERGAGPATKVIKEELFTS